MIEVAAASQGGGGAALVYARTPKEVRDVGRRLQKEGLTVGMVHGNDGESSYAR